MSHAAAQSQDRHSASSAHEQFTAASELVTGQSPEDLSTRAAERLSGLGEMAGGIAHDFRNILTIIDTSLRLLGKNRDDPDLSQRFISAAQTAVDRGLKLTSRLLSLAKQGEVSLQAADANELLQNLDLFLKYGAGPAVRVICSFAPELPKCVVNPAEFNSAMLNLVINARDAMPDGGEIQISTGRTVIEKVGPDTAAPEAYVQVTVADTGEGMTEEVKQRIFEPFFTTKGENGTGLGLPQLSAFMRSIGGCVKVASAPCRGTRFDLLFPVAQGTGT